MPTFESTSVDHTLTLARTLARQLQPNDVLALHGDLGAGKTQFVRGLVAGLGGPPRAVSSPTFVLLHVYDHPPMRLPVYHLDAYRVTSSADFDAIGFPELLTQNGVVVVEWPERITDLLPPTTIHVRLTATGPAARRIDIEGPPGREMGMGTT
jgi:tRNA threonylcarbamoyladenosine biosynthesis protein TsaE